MNRRGFTLFALVLPLLALGACKQPPPSQMSGTWETTYDETTKAKATITQTGDKITGSYSGEGNNGTFEGTVSGKTVNGTWKERDEPALRGTFHWTLDRDGDRFTGRYESEDKKHKGAWNGVKF